MKVIFVTIQKWSFRLHLDSPKDVFSCNWTRGVKLEKIHHNYLLMIRKTPVLFYGQPSLLLTVRR